MFLIELVSKATPLLKPLASVPFAPCPPFPSSLMGKREAEHGVKSCPHSPCPALPHPCSLLLLQLTAPDGGMLADQLKRTGEGDAHTDVHTLLKMLHLPSWAELWGAKCFVPALLDLACHGISFHLNAQIKLSCGAPCSAFPLFLSRNISCQCECGASSLASKEQQVCLRAEPGLTTDHDEFWMCEVPAHLKVASHRLGQVICPFFPAPEEIGNSLILQG